MHACIALFLWSATGGFHPSVEQVSWLEPRTHHQLGKLQKLSKNECGFTLPGKSVNTFVPVSISFIFSGVQLVHKGVH
jgi:hypothetical protein